MHDAASWSPQSSDNSSVCVWIHCEYIIIIYIIIYIIYIIIMSWILMEDGRLAVSLVSELAEERVPCRETRTGLEKLASGITGAVRKTRNSSGRRATGRTISRVASDLNLASNPADETTVMSTVPSKSCVSANRNGNAKRQRKWMRQMNREVMFCYYHVLLSCKFFAFRKPMHQLWCERNPSLTDVSELLHLNSVQTAAKRRMGFLLMMMLLWTLYFVESFLRSCRKSGKFLSVRDNAFQGSL